MEDNKQNIASEEVEASKEDAPVEEVASEEVEASKEDAPAEEVASEEFEASKEDAPVEEVASEEVEASKEDVPVEEVVASEESDQAKGGQTVDAPFIIGKKLGMTRIFDENGNSYPVTLIEAGPCYITQIKSIDTDGYSAVQIGYDEVSEKKLNKPQAGHLKGLDNRYLKYLRECRVEDISNDMAVGGQINSNIFEIGDLVNVSGVSKGKGFAGHMKRHGFGGGRASHGKNSVMRKSGSIGAGSDPSRVWKGTRMAGRMGGDTVTVKNLEILKINNDENMIFLNGSIPGAKNSIVYIAKV